MTIHLEQQMADVSESPRPSPLHPGPLAWRAAKVLILVVTAFALASRFEVDDPGPDALLYHGIAVNLIQGSGFVDTVRNNDLLPPIGHPAILAMTDAVLGDSDGYSRPAIAAGFLLFMLAIQAGSGSIIFAMVAGAVYALMLPQVFRQWGIETTFFWTANLFLWTATIWWLRPGRRTAVVAGLTFAVLNLVRPLFLPWLGLGIAVFTAIAFFRRSIPGRSLALPELLAAAAIPVAAVWAISFGAYGDGRMVGGTYQGFALYAAFNEYVPLDRLYATTLWDDVPEARRMEGQAPMELGPPWQHRDQVLKQKTVEFILTHPGESLKAYAYRLRNLTVWTEGNRRLGVMGWFWLASAGWFIWRSRARRCKRRDMQPGTIAGLGLASAVASIGLVAVQAVFVYVGVRYNSFVIPFQLHTMALAACVLLQLGPASARRRV